MHLKWWFDSFDFQWTEQHVQLQAVGGGSRRWPEMAKWPVCNPQYIPFHGPLGRALMFYKAGTDTDWHACTVHLRLIIVNIRGQTDLGNDLRAETVISFRVWLGQIYFLLWSTNEDRSCKRKSKEVFHHLKDGDWLWYNMSDPPAKSRKAGKICSLMNLMHLQMTKASSLQK